MRAGALAPRPARGEHPAMDVDVFAASVLRPRLEEQGFRARARRFRRETPGFEHVVEIAKGRHMMQGKFCITLYAHPKLEGAPGLPEFPLRVGDHWLRHRVAPTGQSDQWWLSDGLTAGKADAISALLDAHLADWFAPLQTIEGFAGDWYRRAFNLDAEGRRLGLLPARLAYLFAIAMAETGDAATADRIAETALELAGPRAATLRAWIREFRKGLP